MVDPLTAGTAVVTGLKLVKQSVDFIKQNISTAQDIGELVGQIDKAMAGEQQAIKARDKANVDVFAVENVAQEVIDAKIAKEQLYELSQLIDHRFGHGTWRFILAERKKRIDAKKQALKEARAKQLKKQQEIMEYVKYGLIAIVSLAFVGVAVGVTLKFFVSITDNVYAHNLEYDDGTCLVYNPKWWLMCVNEGRELTDTQLYLEYKEQLNDWIIEKD
tara:strand:+ start:38 stop:691 length:654 start_codon:yes stop_codon:yes gene_type:complete